MRIHFTAHDLARTRLRPTLGPLSETAFAVRLLENPVGGTHHRLRRRLARQQPGQPPIREEVRRIGNDPGDGKFGGSPYQVMSDVAVSDPVRRLWHSVIKRNWDRISDHLLAEADWRARLAVRDGIEQLLSTLHPKIIWEPPVLSIAGEDSLDVHLHGRGLLLVPSVFLAHRPAVLVSGSSTETGTLVFSAPPADAEIIRLLDPPDDSPQDLGALVGHTRAAVLRELLSPCTTSELAERVGVSSAGISQHTTVLRNSGLIITRRFRNKVLHSVTPLGLALLGLGSAQGLASRPA